MKPSLPSPSSFVAMTLCVRGAAGAKPGISGLCRHGKLHSLLAASSARKLREVGPQNSRVCGFLQGLLKAGLSPSQKVPFSLLRGRVRGEGAEQRPQRLLTPYLRDLLFGLLQLVGFVGPEQPGLHLPLLLQHGLGILPPLPGLHALVKGSLKMKEQSLSSADSDRHTFGKGGAPANSTAASPVGS